MAASHNPTITEHPFGTIAVDRARTTREGTWTHRSPSVDNPPTNVDEHARTVDSSIHNMLWLISHTERYILWFGLDYDPAAAYRSWGRQLDRDAQTASRRK